MWTRPGATKASESVDTLQVLTGTKWCGKNLQGRSGTKAFEVNMKNGDEIKTKTIFLDRSEEKWTWYLNNRRNEEKQIYWFYWSNEDKSKYSFLNHRRNEDKPKCLLQRKTNAFIPQQNICKTKWKESLRKWTLYRSCIALFYRKRLPQQQGDRRMRERETSMQGSVSLLHSSFLSKEAASATRR